MLKPVWNALFIKIRTPDLARIPVSHVGALHFSQLTGGGIHVTSTTDSQTQKRQLPRSLQCKAEQS